MGQAAGGEGGDDAGQDPWDRPQAVEVPHGRLLHRARQLGLVGGLEVGQRRSTGLTPGQVDHEVGRGGPGRDADHALGREDGAEAWAALVRRVDDRRPDDGEGLRGGAGDGCGDRHLVADLDTETSQAQVAERDLGRAQGLAAAGDGRRDRRCGLVHGFQGDGPQALGADHQLGAVHRRGPLDAVQSAEVLAHARRFARLQRADRAVPRRSVAGGRGDQVVQAGDESRRDDQHRRGEHDACHRRADREADAVVSAVGGHAEAGRHRGAQVRRRQPAQGPPPPAPAMGRGHAPGGQGTDQHDHQEEHWQPDAEHHRIDVDATVERTLAGVADRRHGGQSDGERTGDQGRAHTDDQAAPGRGEGRLPGRQADRAEHVGVSPLPANLAGEGLADEDERGQRGQDGDGQRGPGLVVVGVAQRHLVVRAGPVLVVDRPVRERPVDRGPRPGGVAVAGLDEDRGEERGGVLHPPVDPRAGEDGRRDLRLAAVVGRARGPAACAPRRRSAPRSPGCAAGRPASARPRRRRRPAGGGGRPGRRRTGGGRPR